MVLGTLTITLWLVSLLTHRTRPGVGLNLESLSWFLFYSVPLMAFTTGMLILRRHKYLRDL
jgi:hypothetical protein